MTTGKMPHLKTKRLRVLESKEMDMSIVRLLTKGMDTVRTICNVALHFPVKLNGNGCFNSL